MNNQLESYLNGVFAPYTNIKSVEELKADLSADLQERFLELKAEGKDDETAFQLTIDSIGDIEQTVQEIANASRTLERQIFTNFSASDLSGSDFAGVTVHNGKFNSSALAGSDFSNTDLTGSSFNSSDARNANFSGANLTDCTFSTSDLTGARFCQSKLVRTRFNASGLQKAVFSGCRLTEVRISTTDLRETVFTDCHFENTDFQYCDLRGMCFDGLHLTGVKFDKTILTDATFRGATLNNVSFHGAFGITKKFYRAIKTIGFDGASMDKLTYLALKGLDADLSHVTIV